MYCTSFPREKCGLDALAPTPASEMVRRYRPAHDDHIPSLADLPNQLTPTLRHSAAQNLVALLGDPDQVILDIVDRLRAVPILRHPPIVVDQRWKLTA